MLISNAPQLKPINKHENPTGQLKMVLGVVNPC